MKNFAKLAFILFVVCTAAAGALAFVNQVTYPKIVEQAKVEFRVAMQEVFAESDDFKEAVPRRTWDALKGGEKIGSVILARAQGYSGSIDIVLGVGLDGTLTGMKIMNQTETPGLGSKIAGRSFLDQFLGKGAGAIILKKDDPSGSIDAVTAATISSRAVTAAVRSTLDSFEKGELR